MLLIAPIFIRPDLDPSWHTISEWAIGPPKDGLLIADIDIAAATGPPCGPL